MAKWEYKIVEVVREQRQSFLEGIIVEADFASDSVMVDQLNEYGAKGWELVSVVPIADPSGGGRAPTMRLRYFLKRETY